MRKQVLKLLPLLLCSCMLLCACGKTPEMQYEEGVYTHPKTGVSYTYAPSYYEPIEYEIKDAVATLGQAGNISVYPITGVDEKKMLCTEYYSILCAQGVALPSLLRDFKPDKVHVSKTKVLTGSYATISNADEIGTLTELFQSDYGFKVSEIDAGLEKERYDLKFESAEYPGLYYSIIYWSFEEDVLVYEVISDPSDLESSYPGIEVGVEQYKGEYYAVYNFGKEILYDRTNELCYYAGNVIGSHLLLQEGA